MHRLGYVRSKLDIKILILYFLSKMREPARFEHLNELAYIDGAIDYFDFCECLASLEETGHMEKFDDGFILTETGAKNCALCLNSLSFTVRRKAEKMAENFTASIRRGRHLNTSVTKTPDGEYNVHMELRDEKNIVLSMDILAPTSPHARKLEAGFKAGAESICGNIIAMIIGETGQ